MRPTKRFQEKLAYSVNERLINWLIGLLGVVAVLVGIMLPENLDPIWEAVIVSVGASLIASAVVSYLSSIYMYKRKQAKEITEVWGLCSICETRAEMNTIVTERLKTAEDHLDIIAFGLKSFRETRQNILKERIEHGMILRIITVNPNCELLKQKDMDEEKVEGSTAKSIKELCKWIVELKRIKNAQVEIKFCNTLPTEVYFRIDNYIYVGPYQLNRESQRTITMEYRTTGEAFKYYQNYFELLWSNNSFCKTDTTILNQ